MNKNIFRILVVSMCIALTGIVALQVYWISNAIRLRNEEFDHAVSNALNAFNNKLERNENIRVSRYAFSSDKPFSYEAALEDLFQLQAGSRPSRYVKLNITDTGAAADGHTYTIHRRDSQVFQHATHTEIILVDSVKTKIDHKVRNIVDVVKKIVSEDKLGHEALSNRLPRANAERLLRDELRNTGIDLHFEFKVVSGPGHDSLIYKTNGYDETADQQAYFTKLFPGDIVSQDGGLFLSFHKRNAYIMSDISGMLLLSVLFTLIIIFIFYYTIRVILSQKKLSEIRNDFINNMTHEFKTPIATTSLALDALNNPKVRGNEDQIRYYTAIIKEENARMNQQVERVLQVALTQKKDFELDEMSVDIHAVLQQALNDHALRIRTRNAMVELHLGATKVNIPGNAFHLLHAFSNIIDNALKYTHDPAKLKISTRNAPGELFVEITDNGIGMSRETRKKVFDKFYRAQGGNIHDVKGFGLGLSYAKNVLDRHNAQITVDSLLNAGSTFTIIFKLPQTQ